jgi:hypothetical protein
MLRKFLSKNKRTKIYKTVLVLFFLVFSSVLYLLWQKNVASEKTRSKFPKISIVEPITWIPYEYEKLGFALLIPETNPMMSLEEVSVHESYRWYKFLCEKDFLDGCGGFKLANYTIRFSSDRNELISVDYYQNRPPGLRIEPTITSDSGLTIHKNTSGQGEDIFGETYRFIIYTIERELGAYEIVVSLKGNLTEEIADQLARSFRFMEPVRPLKCLWSGDYEIKNVTDEKTWLEPISGYFFDNDENVCKAVRIFGFVGDAKSPEERTKSARQSTNIPFQNLNSCINSCLSR